MMQTNDKHYSNKRVFFFKKAARHKKHWTYVELLEKKIKNRKLEAHAYIMKARVIR
jgi:hypothetical protein